LQNEPVIARPPSQFYRLRKLVQRRRAALATGIMAGLAALAALMIGMRISRAPVAQNGKHTVTAVNTSEIASATNNAQPPPLRVVSGVVLAADTAKPLSNVLVRAAAPSVDMRRFRSGDDQLFSGLTDGKGHFAINLPQAATLSLDALSPGYESAAGSIMGGPHSGVWLVNLPFTNDAPEFTIKLTPALYVAGVVVDENGHAFPQADVEATMQMKNGMAYVTQTRTGSNGQFAVFDFPLKAWDNDRGQVTFDNPSMLRSTIQDVYQLNEKERRSLRVVLRRGHDVSGVVTSSSGRPVAKTLVEALPSDESASYKPAMTDSDGRFLIKGLPDGGAPSRSIHLYWSRRRKSICAWPARMRK
jgi:hypothetical protein